MWVIFSVLSVLMWGTSDVIFKSSSKCDENSAVRLLAFNGFILGICSFVYMLIHIIFLDMHFSFGILLKYLPVASIYITSMLFYYMALPLIKVSIASPVANCSCVLTTLLCVVFLKQSLNGLQILAILLIVIAIILISTEKDDDVIIEGRTHTRKGFLLGIFCSLIYFLLDGAGSFLDDYTIGDKLSEQEVNVAYGSIYFIVGLGAFVYLKIKGDTINIFRDRKKLAGSFIETGGQFTYVYALASGDAAVISPFIASYSMVSVILSRIFLKEKLKLKQYILIVLMLTGMAILSME